MKRLLFILLTALSCLPSLGQNHLVTHNFIHTKVDEGYFRTKSGVNDIPTDNECINKTDAKNWLYLKEIYLPVENNRMPWWSELVPAATYDSSCTYTLSPACYPANTAYSTCGAYLYDSIFDPNMSYFVRRPLVSASSVWKAPYLPSDPFTQCSPTPILAKSGTPGSARAAIQLKKDSVTGGMQSMMSSELGGALNRCVIWACSPVRNQWLQVSGTFGVPENKIYYVGAAGDNAFRIYIDGNLIVSYDQGDDAESFRIWHIFPVRLTPGKHSIIVQGKDIAGDAGFGCEVYDNTVAQLDAATAYSDLNVLFTTEGLTSICPTESPINPGYDIVVDLDNAPNFCIEELSGLDGYAIYLGNPLCNSDAGVFAGYTSSYLTVTASNNEPWTKEVKVYLNGVWLRTEYYYESDNFAFVVPLPFEGDIKIEVNTYF